MDARRNRTTRVYQERAARARQLLFNIGQSISYDVYHIRLLDLLVDVHHALDQDHLELDLEVAARWAKQIYLYEKGLESGPLPDLPPEFGAPQSGAGGG